MADITGPPTLVVENPSGTPIVRAASIMQFTGSAGVTDAGNGKVVINVGGVGSFANTNLNNLTGPVQPNENIDLQDTIEIINVPTPTAAGDVANKAYVDAIGSSFANLHLSNLVGPVQPNQNIDMQDTHTIIDVPTPVNPGDAVNKAYVDTFSFVVTGTANTVAFFNASGNISSNAQFAFSQANYSIAFGPQSSGGVVVSNGTGSLAFGTASGGSSSIASENNGSFAFGSTLASFAIQAAQVGCFAAGNALTGGVVAAGIGSFAFGDNCTTDSNFGQTFGIGNTNDSYGAFAAGLYSSTSGSNPTTFVGTDPIFSIGNGTSIGSPSTAIRIDKDGRETLTASQINSGIRTVAAAASISARTDHTIVALLSGATGTLLLPPGEKGLFFEFAIGASGSAIYTVAATGPDVLDANVASTLQTGSVPLRLRYLTGTWYSV
jgi:hypothetical protein